MPKKLTAPRSAKAQPAFGGLLDDPVLRVWGWILLIWSLYRYFFHLPEWADEFVFKPLVFLGPVVWYVYNRERRGLGSLGLNFNGFFRSLYIGLGFGFLFALEGLAANYFKYGQLQINPIAAFAENGMVMLLILSLATAFSEEVLNRGFLFQRLLEKTRSLPYASVVSTILFTLLHVPILVLSLKFQGSTLVLFFVTNFILGISNSLLFYTTGSVIAPILVHIFWNMTVALYL